MDVKVGLLIAGFGVAFYLLRLLSRDGPSVSHVWGKPPRLARLLFGVSGDWVTFARVSRIALAWSLILWGVTFAALGEATRQSAAARLAIDSTSVIVVVLTLVGVVIAIADQRRR